MWFKNSQNQILKNSDTLWRCSRGVLLSFLEEPIQTINQIEIKSSQLKKFSFTPYYIKRSLTELEKMGCIQKISTHEAEQKEGQIYDDILDLHHNYLQTLPPLYRANYKNKNYYVLNNGVKDFIEQNKKELEKDEEPIQFEENQPPKKRLRMKSLEEEYPNAKK